MKNIIRNFFIITLIIILGCPVVNRQIRTSPIDNSNKTYGYSMVERKEEEVFEVSDTDVEDVEVDIEEEEETDEGDNVAYEEVDPLFDSSVDIRERIDNYLGDDKYYTSLIYYNLVTEETISFNEDIYMDAASLYKVGLNVVAYNMVNNYEITLDDLVYYSPWQFQGGTGILQYDTSFGSLPLRTLLEYSIVYSDNIAATMVYSYIGGWTNYKWRLFELLGIDYGNYDNITSARVEFEILKYIYDNKESYSELIYDLKNTDFHDRLDKYLPYEEVAHKIGSDEGYTHDVGIVFTDEPYIIVMMTDNVYNGPDKIADISKALYLYNKESAPEKISTGIKPKEYEY